VQLRSRLNLRWCPGMYLIISALSNPVQYPYGPRRKARGDHGRPLLTSPDKVVVTGTYLRRICPQKVLAELLSTNPVTIGQAIKETRALMNERRITVSQSPQ
jgi:hypothetical protein